MEYMIRRRCLAHLVRSRVLGLRFSSTAPQAPVQPTIEPPSNREVKEPPTSKPAPSASNPTKPTPAAPTEVPPPQPVQLQHYLISSPPSQPQLSYSSQYFSSAAAPPIHLWTAARFVQIPRSPFPEVCFVGRSNVGKSSLLNALFGRPKQGPVRVSSKAGHTKTLNAFGVGGTRDPLAKDPLKQLGAGGLIVVDTPGYGIKSRKEWGHEINKFFLKRQQLRKVFVLIDTVHGVKSRDLELLRHFETHSIPYQIILSKVDKIVMTDSRSPSPEKLQKSIVKLKKTIVEAERVLRKLSTGIKGTPDREVPRDILCASSEKEIKMSGWPRGRIGIDAVRWSVLKAAGLECDELGQKKGALEGVNVIWDET